MCIRDRSSICDTTNDEVAVANNFHWFWCYRSSTVAPLITVKCKNVSSYLQDYHDLFALAPSLLKKILNCDRNVVKHCIQHSVSSEN